ncbi:MAG: acyltransferase family protein [Bowdeniella nasicola]|nr:acyltransferase family protein [Bowdeniella nasicola]
MTLPAGSRSPAQSCRPRRRIHLPGLDGMRAPAALMVLVYHLFPGHMRAGLIGVDVFFVISGYLITRLLLHEYQCRGGIDLRAFWLRRIRRLLPALVVVVIISLALGLLVGPDTLVKARMQALSAVTYTYNWAQIASGGDYFTDADPLLLTNVWTLAIEQQFYLVWPIIVVLIARMRGRAVIPLVLAVGSAIAMAVFCGADVSRVYYGTDTHMFGLMIGAAMAMIVAPPLRRRASTSTPPTAARQMPVPNRLASPPRPPVPAQPPASAPRPASAPSPASAPLRVRLARLPWGILGWFGVVGIILIATLFEDSSRHLYMWGLLTASLCAALIIRAVMPEVTAHSTAGRLLLRVLEWKPLVWIGVRSYGIYLWHWPLFVLASHQWPNASVWTIGLGVTAVSILAAHLSLHLLENPMRKNGIVATIRGWVRDTATAVRSGPRKLATTSDGGDSTAVVNLFTGQTTAQRVTHLLAGTLAMVMVAMSGVAFATAPTMSSLEQQIAEAEKDLAEHNVTVPAPADSDSPTPPAAPPTEPAETTAPGEGSQEPAKAHRITFIGDSVMLASSKRIVQTWPNATVDAAVSRAMPALPPIIDQHAAKGTLGDVVVIALATNGIIKDQQIDRLMDQLGPERKVVFVTGFAKKADSWIPRANEAISAAQERYAGRVFVADWHAAIAGKQDLLGPDHTHPRGPGIELYAATLKSALVEAIGQESEALSEKAG